MEQRPIAQQTEAPANPGRRQALKALGGGAAAAVGMLYAPWVHANTTSQGGR